MSQPWRAMIAAVALAPLVACGSGGSAGEGGAISLGYQETTWGAPLILANDMQAWDDTDVEVDPTALSSGKDVRDGMLGGSIDAGSLGSAPFVVGAEQGDVVAVSVIAYAGRTDAIVVPPDSPVEEIADLEGKKIASQSGSVTHEILVSKILPAHGLSEDDVDLVNVTFQDQYSSMDSGQVDAFAGVDPYPSLAVHNETGRILTTYEDYDPTPLYLCVSRNLVEDDPDAVTGLVEGWLLAMEQWKDDPEGTVQTVSAVFAEGGVTMDDAVIERALGNMDVTADFAPDTEEYLTEQAESLISQDAISEVPDWSEVIDTSFLEEAKESLDDQ